ncbi:MAG: hypothetical protein AAFP19_04330 [Bacteroidota bacterium]
MERKDNFFRFWSWAEAGLLLFCGSLWLLDYIWGDGDGLVNRLGVHTYVLLLYGQLFWLLVAGVAFGQKVVSNISLTLLSIFLLLFLAEGLLRWVPSSLTGLHQYTIVLGDIHPFSSRDTIFFKNLVPGSQYLSQTVAADGQKRLLNQINSLGIRGPEIPAKAKGEKRLLLLGDSFLQSDEVSFEQSIGQQLQALSGDSLRFIQHGFPSWSPLLQVNWLLRRGIDLKPDEVILFTFFNDFVSGISADSAYLPYAQFDEQGYPSGFQFTSSSSTADRYYSPSPLQRHFERWYLFRMIKRTGEQIGRANCFLSNEQFDQLLQCPPSDFRQAQRSYPCNDNIHFNYLWDMIGLSRDYSQWDPQTKLHMDLGLKYIALMHRYLSERNIPLRIVYIPSAWQFEEENLLGRAGLGIDQYIFPEGGINRALEQFCDQRAIPFLSLYPAFRNYKNSHSQILYYPSDGHWNEWGHQVAARAVHQWLFEQINKPPEPEGSDDLTNPID